MKSTKFWIILICIVLAVSAAAGWFLNADKSKGKYAEIYQNGTLIRTADLRKDATFTVTTEGGGYNTVQIKNGAISVIDASCPDKICIREGAISDGTKPIVCLPNKLVIKVVASLPGGPDAIAG